MPYELEKEGRISWPEADGMLTVLYKSGLPSSSHFRKPCKLRNVIKELLSFPRSAKPKVRPFSGRCRKDRFEISSRSFCS